MPHLLNPPFSAFSHFVEMKNAGHTPTSVEEVEELLDLLVEQGALQTFEAYGNKFYKLNLDA